MQVSLKTILNLKAPLSRFVYRDVRLAEGAEPRIEATIEPRRLTTTSVPGAARGTFPDECCFQVIYFVCNISFGDPPE